MEDIILTICLENKEYSQTVAVTMPVSSVGYVNRLKVLSLPLDAKRYGPRNHSRNHLAIFIVCEWPYGHGQSHWL